MQLSEREDVFSEVVTGWCVDIYFVDLLHSYPEFFCYLIFVKSRNY